MIPGDQVRDRISGGWGVFLKRSYGSATVRWENPADENGNYVSAVPYADLETVNDLCGHLPRDRG